MKKTNPKKVRRLINKHWRVEIKGFIKSAGELGLRAPRFPKLSSKFLFRWLSRWTWEPTKIPFRVRWGYAKAILLAPRLARKGTLTDYIKKHWPGKADGLHEQGWVRYEKVAGPIRFQCRTRRDAPGVLVQVLVQETYWDEPKALGLLGNNTVAKEIAKIYHMARIHGQDYQEALQDYKDLVDEAAKKSEDEKLKKKLDNPEIAKKLAAAGKVTS